MNNPEIRTAVTDDASAIASLTSELGYPCSTAEATARLKRLSARSDAQVWVGCLGGEVAGWVQAQTSEVLESGYRVEIVGLVVSRTFRRQGVGRALLRKVEEWAAAVGAVTLVVRSNVQRQESHDFFPAVGFVPTKTQRVYRKTLIEVGGVGGADSEVGRPHGARLGSCSF